jgi:glycosyltransferase involved in cell wall biosynthesis
MKILVFAHRLEVGGTQTNAIELAAALRDLHGWDVVLFATPGPMLTLVEEKKIRFLPAPDARFHPSLLRMRALRQAVRSEQPDLIHVWDWWQCLEAYYSVHLPTRIPTVVSDMMMDLTRVLPKSPPTTFGTPELVEKARAAGRRRVALMPPPVDVHLNAPNIFDPRSVRERYGLKKDDIVLVTVSRLAQSMKAESLVRTIETTRTLGRDMPIRFVIVGDGLARERLMRIASETNAELGRAAVLLIGPLLDPRPLYAAADIVIGMGGSALRGMAFAKPVVVVGERNFSALMNPETSRSFYHRGIYGRGSGDPSNAGFTETIRKLVEARTTFPALGQFSRQFVTQHFSLESVSAGLDAFCRSAIAERPLFGASVADGLRTAAVYLRERRFRGASRDRRPTERDVSRSTECDVSRPTEWSVSR